MKKLPLLFFREGIFYAIGHCLFLRESASDD